MVVSIIGDTIECAVFPPSVVNVALTLPLAMLAVPETAAPMVPMSVPTLLPADTWVLSVDPLVA
jgi:hypothetical protein